MIQDLLNSFNLMEKLLFCFSALFFGFLQYLLAMPFRKKLLKLFVVLLLNVAFAILTLIFFFYSPIIHAIFLVFSLPLALLLVLSDKVNKKVSIDPIWTLILYAEKGKVILQNIKRGIVIFGSAGSGKTESGYVPLFKHACEKNIALLNYDYKDGELTEIANYFLQESDLQKATIIPHKPQISDRVNPFSPKYLVGPEMCAQQAKIIFNNLLQRQPNAQSNFFDEVPEAALTGVIWLLREKYPKYCTLPHAISLCLYADPFQLSEFLQQDRMAQSMASPFIDSLTSKDQLAGVKASLDVQLRKLAYPNIFWIMSADEVNLDINHPDNPTFLNIVNNPKLNGIYNPFIALIIGTAINAMQERGRIPSILSMDEGATVTLPGFSKIPATMRSYNIATVFGTQDFVIAKETYGEVATRSILTNLSYQMIGKANDPEAIRYYKSISSEIEKEMYSQSYKKGLFNSGENRETKSLRETSKFKNQDFSGLNPGEFYIFSDGTEKKYKLKQTHYDRIEPIVKHHITEADINQNFRKITDEALSLI